MPGPVAPNHALALSGINRFPVKSCRGQSVDSAVVEPWGLAGDRRWMLVDDRRFVVTARKFPRLLLVSPTIVDGGLLLTAPDAEPLVVATPVGADLTPVTVWKSTLLASPAGPAAGAWFSALIGIPVHLVYLDDPTRRHTDPQYSSDGDRVSFADAYPLLLATEASLAVLNDWIAAGPDAREGAMSMTRFRPSLVVAGAAPWDEDDWRRVRVGEATFRVVKASDRCVLTTADPETARMGKEPLATLRRHRRWDRKVWFAVNLIPDTPGVTLRVGDEVEVLERTTTGEPLR